MTTLHILPFEPRFVPDFMRLNSAWIEQFYKLEEEDRRFLADPKRYIIDSGGMVFFLLENGVVAGTCGIIKMDDETYELVRMAVDPAFHGKRYGETLVNHASNWAKERGALQIILETGATLKPATKLYERIGFEHYEPKPEHRLGLARADVFMRRTV